MIQFSFKLSNDDANALIYLIKIAEEAEKGDAMEAVYPDDIKRHKAKAEYYKALYDIVGEGQTVILP